MVSGSFEGKFLLCSGSFERRWKDLMPSSSGRPWRYLRIWFSFYWRYSNNFIYRCCFYPSWCDFWVNVDFHFKSLHCDHLSVFYGSPSTFAFQTHSIKSNPRIKHLKFYLYHLLSVVNCVFISVVSGRGSFRMMNK